MDFILHFAMHNTRRKMVVLSYDFRTIKRYFEQALAPWSQDIFAMISMCATKVSKVSGQSRLMKKNSLLGGINVYF